MIQEDTQNQKNTQLAEYNAYLKSLAAEKKCPVADLNAEMQAALNAPDTPRDGFGSQRLTTDGVHMAPRGNIVMACGVLKTLGVPAAKLEELRQGWLKQGDLVALTFDPNITGQKIYFDKKVSALQWERLAAVAALRAKQVGHLAGMLAELDIKHLLLKPAGEFDTILLAGASPKKAEYEKRLAAIFGQQTEAGAQILDGFAKPPAVEKK